MSELNAAGIEKTEALIASVEAAGLSEAADAFRTVYWAFLRTIEAYRYGLPYVEQPEDGRKPHQALHIVNVTIKHWAPLVPGSPSPPIDNQAVRDEAAADEAWHREEDRRMRREFGEEI